MVRILWILALGGAVWGYLRYFEWRNVFAPSLEIESTPAEFGLEFEDVTFISEDGRLLHGWWIPHEKARGTIIHCHGNAGNIGDRAWMAADLHRLGVNVFLFDYRGYGRSRGLPTEQGTYRDARAAYEVVRARYEDVENPPVIVHGQSLGGGIAIQLALDKPVRALIAESAFSSTVDIGQHLYPLLPIRLFCRFRYDSVAKVPRLTIPKLFASSRHDEVAPFELGRKLYDAAAEPKQFVELTGGHNDSGWGLTPAYWSAIEALVTKAFGPPLQ
ncbi:MAG: hypothetical protein BWK77_06590 [Verrucomicrobia bacterium A1]|nr:MAG: hypothetical protein BWK77_06590 [Verrucomicrobia bacterium A1]